MKTANRKRTLALNASPIWMESETTSSGTRGSGVGAAWKRRHISRCARHRRAFSSRVFWDDGQNGIKATPPGLSRERRVDSQSNLRAVVARATGDLLIEGSRRRRMRVAVADDEYVSEMVDLMHEEKETAPTRPSPDGPLAGAAQEALAAAFRRGSDLRE